MNKGKTNNCSRQKKDNFVYGTSSPDALYNVHPTPHSLQCSLIKAA